MVCPWLPVYRGGHPHDVLGRWCRYRSCAARHGGDEPPRKTFEESTGRPTPLRQDAQFRSPGSRAARQCFVHLCRGGTTSPGIGTGAILWTMSKVRPSVRRLFANIPVEWSNGWILHRPGVGLCRGSTTQAPVQRGRCAETVQVSEVKTLPNHRGAHQKSATVALAGCRRRCGRCRGPDQEQ